MSIALFTKSIPKFKKIELVGLIIGLILSQIIVSVFHYQEDKMTETAVRSILGKHEFSSNPYKASQALETLETIGLTRCGTLSIDNQQIFFKNNPEECSKNSIFFERSVKLQIPSISGQTWNLDLKVKSSRATETLLMTIRFLFSLTGLMLMVLYVRKIEKKDLEIKTNKKIADISFKVAHDIRSPLSALQAIASSAKSLDLESRQIIKDVVLRVNDIAEDLLSTNKPPANPEPKQPGSISKTAECDIIYSLNKLIEEKNILNPEFEIVFANNNDHLIAQISPNQFSRIISNLINNSIEASASEKKIHIQVFQTNEYINIELLDFGIGIEEDILKKLGKHTITTKGSKGNGLGLKSAFEAVESVGGKLTVTSKVGVGTQAIISLTKVSP